ncbi:hypothetical protein P8452_03527 [Trifolium repens]|nr:hypothetical protein P8452_03527 [Trifolium repens]
MQRFLDSHDPSLPVVIIIQLCKLKKYLGVMGISNAFYGTKLMLNADIPEVTDYIQRMNDANVELTQVLSQVSGPAVLSVADDLMQTRRMTIEDLIESTEKCYGTVLAWACEIDNESDLGSSDSDLDSDDDSNYESRMSNTRWKKTLWHLDLQLLGK